MSKFQDMGFVPNNLNYWIDEKNPPKNRGLRDTSGSLKGMLLDLLLQLVFQISNLLEHIPSWESGS